MNLRPYQLAMGDAIEARLAEGPSTLVIGATGTGKTVVAANAFYRGRHRGRGLLLAHREELINQGVATIQKATCLRCDVEMAERYSYTGSEFEKSDVVVSSFQTQNAKWGTKKRMHRFPPSEFWLLVHDEGHHAPAKTHITALEYYQQNPALKLLGMTATPDRLDEKALGRVFKSVAYVYEIDDAIRDGWLVEPWELVAYVTGIDLSIIKGRKDLNEAELAEQMEREKPLHGISETTLEVAGTRKTLLFAASVAHAERLCEIFNRKNPHRARFVHDKTPKDVRRQMFRDYRGGKFQILCNFGITTEGYDEPSIEVVAIARPTKSRALFAQMCGRGTRPLTGIVDPWPEAAQRVFAIRNSAKPNLTVINFTGKAGHHKLMGVADILGGKMTDDVIARAKQKVETADKPVDVLEELKVAERVAKEEWAVERRRRIEARVTFRTKVLSLFDALDVQPERVRGWDDTKIPSQAMLDTLSKAGISTTKLSYAECSQLIDAIVDRHTRGLCSYRQQRVIMRYGYDPDTTYADARRYLDRLAANGWKRPRVA